MSKYSNIIALIGVIIFGCSCQRAVIEPQQTELIVHSGTQDGVLRLPGDASETQIKVESSSPDWAAISLAEWLRVVPMGTKLRMISEANPDAIERKTQIQIFAGGITQHIEVIQAAGSPSLELGFAPQRVHHIGGEVRVDINSNGSDWTASTDAAWLQINRDLREGQLILKVSENPERYERRAFVDVRASADSEVKRFEVVQSGIVYWILPLLGNTFTPEQIEEGEIARKHILQGVPPRYSRERIFKYTTVSPAFTRIDYSFNHLSHYLYCKAILRDREILSGEDREEYISFLDVNGFSHLGQHVYWSKERRIEAEILLNMPEPCVRFVYYPAETTPATVGHPFPLSAMVIGTTTSQEVEDYQSTIGGVLTSNTQSRKIFTHTPDEGKPFTYEYYFSNGVMSELRFKTPNLFRYIYVGGNAVYITEDFRRMLRENGFEYYTYDPYSMLKQTYRNPSTNTEMVIQLMNYGGYSIQVTFKRYN